MFFVAVLAISAARDPQVPTVFAAAGLLAVYGARFAVRRWDRSESIWLGVLTVAWAAAVLVVSVAFVWVSVPLLFLHLLTFPIRRGLAAVAVITGIVIVAESLDDGLLAAEVAGPILGAGFAIVACVGYRQLANEHELTRRTLEELEITRSELARAEHERGMIDERRRLAREVHDTVAQDLAGILLLVRSPVSDDTTGRIESLASSALREARRIVDALGPVELETTSLPAALTHLEIDDRGGGDDVQVEVTGEPRDLPHSHEAMLLRVAQSALANSREHARATKVFITLTYHDDEVSIDVVDDGVGFEPCAVDTDRPTGRFGLTVMRERAEQVGGKLVVESGLGSGTAVHASVPSP